VIRGVRASMARRRNENKPNACPIIFTPWWRKCAAICGINPSCLRLLGHAHEARGSGCRRNPRAAAGLQTGCARSPPHDHATDGTPSVNAAAMARARVGPPPEQVPRPASL